MFMLHLLAFVVIFAWSYLRNTPVVIFSFSQLDAYLFILIHPLAACIYNGVLVSACLSFLQRQRSNLLRIDHVLNFMT